MQKQRGFGLVEIIIVMVILGGLVAGGWYLWQENQKTPVPAPVGQEGQQQQAPQPSTPATKKYTNTKYGYSFEYPMGSKAYAGGPMGGEQLPLTPESDQVMIGVGEKRFEVWSTGRETLSTHDIYLDFSGTVTQEDIIIDNITWQGTPGLKVTFKDPAFTASYYYLQKAIGSPVVAISASAGLETVASTFRFQ